MKFQSQRERLYETDWKSGPGLRFCDSDATAADFCGQRISCARILACALIVEHRDLHQSCDDVCIDWRNSVNRENRRIEGLTPVRFPCSFARLRVISRIVSLPTKGDPRNHTKNHETHLSFSNRGQFNDCNPACGYVESNARPTVHHQTSL